MTALLLALVLAQSSPDQMECGTSTAGLTLYCTATGIERILDVEHDTQFTGTFAIDEPTGRVVRAYELNDATDYSIFADTFAGASGALDAVGSPETGDSWTEVDNQGGIDCLVHGGAGVLSVFCNSCAVGGTCQYTAGDGALYTADATYPSADYQAELQVGSWWNDSNSVAWMGVRVNYTGSENGYFLRLGDYNNGGGAELWLADASAWSELGEASVTLAANDVWILRVYGTTLEAYQNDVLVLAATDANISAAGEAALGSGDIGRSATLDDWGAATNHAYFNVDGLPHLITSPTFYVESNVTETVGDAIDAAPVSQVWQKNTEAQGPAFEVVSAGAGPTLKFNCDGTTADPAASVITDACALAVQYASCAQSMCVNGQLSVGSTAGLAPPASTGHPLYLFGVEGSVSLVVDNGPYGTSTVVGADANGTYIGNGLAARADENDLRVYEYHRTSRLLWIDDGGLSEIEGSWKKDGSSNIVQDTTDGNATQTADFRQVRTSAGVVQTKVNSLGNQCLMLGNGLCYYDADDSNYQCWTVPAALSGDTTFTDVDGDGAAGQVRVTSGAAVLTWEKNFSDYVFNWSPAWDDATNDLNLPIVNGVASITFANMGFEGTNEYQTVGTITDAFCAEATCTNFGDTCTGPCTVTLTNVGGGSTYFTASVTGGGAQDHYCDTSATSLPAGRTRMRLTGTAPANCTLTVYGVFWERDL
jgi:hypothetical protein